MTKERELALAKIGKHLIDNIYNPEVRQATAAKITQEVSNRLVTTDITPLIFETQTIKFGDEIEFQEMKGGMKAYFVESDGHTPRSQAFKRTYRPTPKDLHVHPTMNLKLLKSGRYGTTEDLINAGVEAIQLEQNKYVFDTLEAAVQLGNANYASCSNVTTLQSALDYGINWVADRGGVRSIVGRASILRTVNKFPSQGTIQTFPESTLEDIMNRGVVSVYTGVPLVGLQRQEDAFGMSMVPANELWVVGNNIGRFVYETEMDSIEDIDVNTWEWHINMYRRIAALVIFPQNIFRIKLA